MSLRNKIALSIFNMGVQRVLDFVTMFLVTTLIVRSLGREEYGMLSIVISYGLLFNILNVSISSVLLRDYQKIKGRISEYMHAFLLFSVFKAVVVLLLSVVIGVYLYRHYGNSEMIAVLAVNAACTILLYIAEPFATLLSVDFRQIVLTKINFISSLANIILSAGAILLPTALFVSSKNTAVALIGLVLTVGYARKTLFLKKITVDGNSLRLLKESFVGFSLWSHLIGIMTDIIYRADLLILGWLGASLKTVGNYNIALQISNLSKLLPQILQYNATLGLSNSQKERLQNDITFLFVKYSFLLSVATMIGYVLFGHLIIRIIAKSDVDEIYNLGFYIIAGLCIFNTFRPLISYGTVVHSIQECFFYAIVPSTLGTITLYIIMGILWNAEGLAKANLFAGIIMTVFTLLYIHSKTKFRWHFVFITDMERTMFARFYAKLKK